MKKLKFWHKQKKNNISQEKEDEDQKEEPKQIGVYRDFLVFDKIDKYKNEKLDLDNYILDDSNLKILQNSPNKTKSRFSKLFEEILENDKKTLLEEKSKENNNLISNNENKNILQNEINNNFIDEDNKIKIINDNQIKKDNFNKIKDTNNDNIINIDNININNINDNIKNNNNYNINNNINIININNINQINYNNRNNSESFSNMQSMDTNTIYNNYFQERKPSELSFTLTNQSFNLPNSGPHLYEHKNSIYSNNSGPYEHKKSLYSNFSGPHEHDQSTYSNYSLPHGQKKSIYSNSSGLYGVSTNDSDYSIVSNSSLLERNSIFEPRPSIKKFDINVDIKKVICLEDRRTTLMIKNIPNKFTREMILGLINKNFKGAYDLFILPSDANRYKNFGYAFINFTCSYYVPYFYFLFNGKKWSCTNSQKVCEITYSKIQGKNNLLTHYSHKIIFYNNDITKYNIAQKYIIPNEYRVIFDKAFPNYNVEEYKYYFLTKMPFKY